MSKKGAVRCFRSVLRFVVVAMLSAGAALNAQNGTGTRPANMMVSDAHPTFDVATIKRSDPDSRSPAGVSVEGHRILYTNQTVKELVLLAYGIQEQQLVSAPEWLGIEKYDIDGVPDVDGRPNLQQMQEMYTKLLADRFGLKVHKEKRELAVYALALGKGGPKIGKSQGDPNGLPVMSFTPTPQLITLKVSNATMADFLLEMQALMNRPLVDQTELKGRFDFTLRWTPDESQLSALGWRTSPSPDSANSQPGLFTAIQEQAGLRGRALSFSRALPRAIPHPFVSRKGRPPGSVPATASGEPSSLEPSSLF